jgi:hypothetical protein
MLVTSALEDGDSMSPKRRHRSTNPHSAKTKTNNSVTMIAVTTSNLIYFHVAKRGEVSLITQLHEQSLF